LVSRRLAVAERAVKRRGGALRDLPVSRAPGQADVGRAQPPDIARDKSGRKSVLFQQAVELGDDHFTEAMAVRWRVGNAIEQQLFYDQRDVVHRFTMA
jgi:hypothetical protein